MQSELLEKFRSKIALFFYSWIVLTEKWLNLHPIEDTLNIK